MRISNRPWVLEMNRAGDCGHGLEVIAGIPASSLFIFVNAAVADNKSIHEKAVLVRWAS